MPRLRLLPRWSGAIQLLRVELDDVPAAAVATSAAVSEEDDGPNSLLGLVRAIANPVKFVHSTPHHPRAPLASLELTSASRRLQGGSDGGPGPAAAELSAAAVCMFGRLASRVVATVAATAALGQQPIEGARVDPAVAMLLRICAPRVLAASEASSGQSPALEHAMTELLVQVREQ